MSLPPPPVLALDVQVRTIMRQMGDARVSAVPIRVRRIGRGFNSPDRLEARLTIKGRIEIDPGFLRYVRIRRRIRELVNALAHEHEHQQQGLIAIFPDGDPECRLLPHAAVQAHALDVTAIWVRLYQRQQVTVPDESVCLHSGNVAHIRAWSARLCRCPWPSAPAVRLRTELAGSFWAGA